MNIKKSIKNLAPAFLLNFYHYGLALIGTVVFWFPGNKLIVIGVTGTSGKSTTVDFITKILEENGNSVASISSIRFKIGDKEFTVEDVYPATNGEPLYDLVTRDPADTKRGVDQETVKNWKSGGDKKEGIK